MLRGLGVIGEGIVRDLRAAGADVVPNYSRSKDRAEAIADELGRDHCTAMMASGQITMRCVDGWKTLDQAPVEQPIGLAA